MYRFALAWLPFALAWLASFALKPLARLFFLTFVSSRHRAVHAGAVTMDFWTVVLLLLLLIVGYWGIELVRRTLSRYASDLHAALHELKKTKTALADAGRSLRTSAGDVRGLRLRAELAEEARARAETRAEAAETQVAQLRERLGNADGRLQALQESAQENVMRWEGPGSAGARFSGSGSFGHGRFGAGDVVSGSGFCGGAGEDGVADGGSSMGGNAGGSGSIPVPTPNDVSGGSVSASLRRQTLRQLRRAPLEAALTENAPRTSGGLLPEAFLLAQRPDLAESDSEDEEGAGVGDGAEDSWRRRPARPPAVTVPPPRRRRTPVAVSSSPSPPPSRARRRGGRDRAVLSPEDASGDADSEGGEGRAPGRVLARKGLVGAGLKLRRAERLPLSTSESSSLSSLSTGVGGRVGGFFTESPKELELEPGRWPRSRAAGMGFRVLGSDDLVQRGGS